MAVAALKGDKTIAELAVNLMAAARTGHRVRPGERTAARTRPRRPRVGALSRGAGRAGAGRSA